MSHENPFQLMSSVEDKEQERRYPVAIIELLGRQKEQQDAHKVKVIEKNGQKILSVIVADGHDIDDGSKPPVDQRSPGAMAAHLAVERIFNVVSSQSLTEETLRDAFLQAHGLMVQKTKQAGATATAVFLKGRHLLIGWAGNSQARAFSSENTLHTLTIPHEYGVHRAESRRLDQQHAIIIANRRGYSSSSGYFDTYDRPRRGAILKGAKFVENTRSLGDADMEPHVIHEPEIKHVLLSPQERFLIIATDGFWNKLTSPRYRNKIETCLAKAKSVTEAEDAIRAQLSKWKLDDNVSIVIVGL